MLAFFYPLPLHLTLFTLYTFIHTIRHATNPLETIRHTDAILNGYLLCPIPYIIYYRVASACSLWHTAQVARSRIRGGHTCQRDRCGVCAYYPQSKELYWLLRRNTNGFAAFGAILFAGEHGLGGLAASGICSIFAILSIALAQIGIAASAD